MSRRILLLVALVWLPFLMLPAFASFGDTSYPHLAGTDSAARRGMLRALLLCLTRAVVGHVAELATAIARFAQDGFVNRNTADVWESGPHFHAANVTIPSMMLAMITVVVLAVTATVQGRSRRSAAAGGPRDGDVDVHEPVVAREEA